MEPKFYVYIYLNPLIKDTFIYDDLILDYEPLYIGMGSGTRDTVHISTAKLKYNTPFYNKLREIIDKVGELPLHFRIKTDLTQQQAYKLEEYYIKLIGKKCKNEGPLLNISDGVGRKGVELSKEFKERMKEVHLGRKHTEQAKQNMSKAQVGKVKSKESIDKRTLKQQKAILEYDENMNIINRYVSLSEASEKTGYVIQTIWRCCRKQNFTHKRTTFRYENPKEYEKEQCKTLKKSKNKILK